MDIIDIWKPLNGIGPDSMLRPKQVSFYNRILSDLGIPTTVDLIMSNPPWIPASNLGGDIEKGVNDPKEELL